MLEFDPKFSLSVIVQALGFVVAIGVVFFQLKKQRDMQAERHRIELQVATYEKITVNFENSSPTGVATSLDIVCGALGDATQKIEEIGRYVPPPIHPDDINNDYRKVQSQLWKAAATLEKYEITSPNLPLFREVLVKKLRELTDAYMPIIRTLPYVLLSEKGINEADKLLVLDDKDIKIFEEKILEFSEIAYDIAAYLSDIQVELQNILLGEVYKRKLSIRKPENSNDLVLTSGQESMLQKARNYLNE